MTPAAHRPALLTLALLPVLLLGACAAGPDYQRPGVATPAVFRHDAGWRTVAAAQSAGASHGANAGMVDGWSAFGDPLLQRLVEETAQGNQTLAQAEARYRQAVAVLGASRSEYFPQVGARTSATRSGGGGGNSNNTRTTNAGTTYAASLELSWVPDLWGRVRRQVEADQARLQASDADRAAARLAQQVLVAQAYFQLRIIDRQNALLQQTLVSYDRALQLTRNQYEAGIVARADVIQSETQRESLRVQIFTLERQRTQAEHAIAVLLGRAPGQWQLPPAEPQTQQAVLPGSHNTLVLPAVAAQLPSELLLRRPDIVAAERQVAAANASIGVAESGWWPELTLGASVGGNASRFAQLLDTPQRVWSLGPSLAATLFDGGRRAAATQQAQALYDERVAAYRQSALTAWQEVEDALAGLQSLTAQSAQQQRLVALAQENERVVTNRYREGLVSFLELSTAQNLTYTSQRNALDTLGEQLATSVRLLAALGGGWALPTAANP
ncbi:MAG: efflux transporter outer membrane subunit [Comamonadaceae bacterium]|nr:MAG: efflux transporter outer membrane subunit [Comamonadaceae bacterium]